MYPQWLTDGLEWPDGGLEDQLRAAIALVPDGLAEECGLMDEVRECLDLSYFHFTMNTLQSIGIWAEDHGRDAELPAEYWRLVASAADRMMFPEFVPYCLGKAKGLGRHDTVDLMSAFVSLPHVVDVDPDSDLGKRCAEAADILYGHAPDLRDVVASGDLAAIAVAIRSHVTEEVFGRLSEPYSSVFDELFATVTAESFPPERATHGWAVVDTNPFTVAIGGGLFTTTYAQVWWRAEE